MNKSIREKIQDKYYDFRRRNYTPAPTKLQLGYNQFDQLRQELKYYELIEVHIDPKQKAEYQYHGLKITICRRDNYLRIL